MDLNYTRDTTSAAKDSSCSERCAPGCGAAGRRHDRLGQHRDGRRSDAPRRARASCRNRGTTRRSCEVVRREVDDGQALRRRDASRAREHEEARLIQQALLPRRCRKSGLHAAPRVDAGIRYRRRLLRRHQVRDTRVAVSIADVVGKGLPAALLMSNLQAAVRAFATRRAEPHDVCASVNRLLCRNIASGSS
jgi:sigma-B regulation protein RsbU (phosphoserine phosphatase)